MEQQKTLSYKKIRMKIEFYNVTNKNFAVIKTCLVLLSCLRYNALFWSYISSFTSFNPLQPGVAFLYPLKTSENLQVF